MSLIPIRSADDTERTRPPAAPVVGARPAMAEAQAGVRARSQFESHGRTHEVAWLASDEVAAGPFIDELCENYGPALATTVAQAFQLDAATTRRFSATRAQAAVDAAETGRQALDGVDFLTKLEHSAVCNGLAFRRALQAEGIDPARLDPGTRLAIDRCMDKQFNDAARRGEGPVNSLKASEMLKKALILLTR